MNNNLAIINDMAKMSIEAEQFSMRYIPTNYREKKSNYYKLAYDLCKLEPHKEVLSKNKKILKYLLNDINELPIVNASISRDKMLNELIPVCEKYEKLSSFEAQDVLNVPTFITDPKMQYLGMYINRLIRTRNVINTNGDEVFKAFSSVRHCVDEYLENMMELGDESIEKLLYVKGISILDQSNVSRIKDLQSKDFMALVNYVTRYGTYDISNFCSVEDAGIVLNLLNKIYLLKVRPYIKEMIEQAKKQKEIESGKEVSSPEEIAAFRTIAKNYDFANVDTIAHVMMNIIITNVVEDQFDKKRLRGFYNNLDFAFFEKYIEEDCLTFNTVCNFCLFEYYNIATGRKFDRLLGYSDINGMIVIGRFPNVIGKAVKEKKYSFLDTIVQNIDELAKDGYGKNVLNSNVMDLVNLNEINGKDILELAMLENGLSVEDKTLLLNLPTKLTPKELISLEKYAAKKMVRLYAQLDTSVDKKLVILRQLNKINVEFSALSDDDIKTVAEKLSERNLAQRKTDYKFYVPDDVLFNSLILRDEYTPMLASCKELVELEFILRNQQTIDLSKTLEENLDEYIDKDKDCVEMFELMDLSESFKNEHKDSIKNFCLIGNASIVMKYYKSRKSSNDKTRIDNMFTIAKAEMAGEMERFKFFNLEKEIEKTLTPEIKNAWMHNEVLEEDGIKVYESYSFKDTMNIGVEPTHTCMNYEEGIYNECLLANFDANKKVLYAVYNGKCVGRAIIRLTKSLENSEDTKNSGVVKFLDVETGETETSTKAENDEITVFIERPYFGYVNEKMTKKIKMLFIKTVTQKTKDANIVLIASGDYGDCGLRRVTRYVFISHTKNGSQYLDSFDGKTSMSKEASYNSSSCFVL